MSAGARVETSAEPPRDANLPHEAGRARTLDLPPAITRVVPPIGRSGFAFACEAAAELGAGTLVWSPDADQIDLAVVLEPDESLATARGAFLVGMSALVDAVASVAPPDKTLSLDWPDIVRFDGARLGGGRLAWPDGTSDEAIPGFLVFGASLIVSKARTGDPGLTPESTSLEEEGFEEGCDVAIVEAFARYLMRGFHAWRTESFEAATIGFTTRLRVPGEGSRPTLDGVGNLVLAAGQRMELAPALRAPGWLDPGTGRVRL